MEDEDKIAGTVCCCGLIALFISTIWFFISLFFLIIWR